MRSSGTETTTAVGPSGVMGGCLATTITSRISLCTRGRSVTGGSHATHSSIGVFDCTSGGRPASSCKPSAYSLRELSGSWVVADVPTGDGEGTGDTAGSRGTRFSVGSSSRTSGAGAENGPPPEVHTIRPTTSGTPPARSKLRTRDVTLPTLPVSPPAPGLRQVAIAGSRAAPPRSYRDGDLREAPGGRADHT
jgi:hypothetical protein